MKLNVQLSIIQSKELEYKKKIRAGKSIYYYEIQTSDLNK